MDSFESLVEHFRKFPGIGPRQARRFAYYLLTRDSATLKNIADLVLTVKKENVVCKNCFRFFPKKKSVLCTVCADESREKSLLMVVGHDIDIDVIEKSGSYRGFYFVLGGTIPILEKKPETRVRIKELLETAKSRPNIAEIILALDVNPEGDYTLEYVANMLEPIAKSGRFTVTHLGRGLSTGTELEYSDSETIKNALRGRTA